MPTEENNGGTSDETSGEQQQDQKTTPETGGNGTQETGTPSEPQKLPDDHPLVKSLAAQKTQIASQKDEIRDLQATSRRVTELEAELKDRPSKEGVEQLQTRYDRLEAFVQAAGGNISKALDSRTFTRDLFESDKPIDDIVKAFNKANPTATSTALGSGGADPAPGKVNPNDLIRAAMKSS